MGLKRTTLWVLVAGSLLAGVGCVSPSPEAHERLQAIEQEGRELDLALDSTEERLLGNQARLHMWQELGRRHKEVAAVHCQHADMHLTAMAAHLDRQEEKARGLKKRRMTVSSVMTSSNKRRN